MFTRSLTSTHGIGSSPGRKLIYFHPLSQENIEYYREYDIGAEPSEIGETKVEQLDLLKVYPDLSDAKLLDLSDWLPVGLLSSDDDLIRQCGAIHLEIKAVVAFLAFQDKYCFVCQDSLIISIDALNAHHRQQQHGPLHP